MKTIRTPFLVAALACAVAVPVHAQRGIIGAEEDEEDGEKKPAPPPAEEPSKKDDGKKKKKDDKKKAEEKKPAEPVKPDAKSTPTPPPSDKKKGDVLEDTAAEKTKRAAEEAKRREAEAAAEKAADEAAAKKAAEDAKKLEEKKAADEKRRKETRDQRLAAAKKLRQLVRTSGTTGLGMAVEPGMPVAGQVTELRVAVTKKLDVPDPRFGDLMPMDGLKLVATVEDASGKKDAWKRRYLLHPLEAPGKYGFHVTLPKDGAYRVRIDGDVAGDRVDVQYPVHAGVWPPPDFDEEEKKALEATGDAKRGGRSIISE